MGVRSRMPSWVSLNSAILLVGIPALWFGADRLATDNWGYVLAYLAVVLASMVLLLLYANRQSGERESWLNGLIVGVGSVVMSVGAGRLIMSVDNFNYVLAYIALILAGQVALILYVKRRVG